MLETANGHDIRLKCGADCFHFRYMQRYGNDTLLKQGIGVRVKEKIIKMNQRKKRIIKKENPSLILHPIRSVSV